MSGFIIKKGSFEKCGIAFNTPPPVSKILFFSLAIQEKIQKIVDKKTPLIINRSTEPFLENACCNEGDPNTNIFFSNKDSSIQKYNKIMETNRKQSVPKRPKMMSERKKRV